MGLRPIPRLLVSRGPLRPAPLRRIALPRVRDDATRLLCPYGFLRERARVGVARRASACPMNRLAPSVGSGIGFSIGVRRDRARAERAPSCGSGRQSARTAPPGKARWEHSSPSRGLTSVQMDGRQGSEEKPGRGRRLGRTVWVAYLTTGAALAIFRVSLLAWVFNHWAEGQINETLAHLISFLRPEMLSGGLALWGDTFHGKMPRFLFWASVLTVGSFIMATPILLVGWLRQRR